MNRIRKLSWMGAFVAVVAAAAVCSPGRAAAEDFDPGLTHWEAANTLIMPYDVTSNRESFQIVSKIGPSTCDDPTACENPIATHWAFWSKDCDHLGDVFICLTQNDTVVVDPKHLQSQTQKPDKSGALLLGDEINIDLVGGASAKGLVTVTAYVANIGQSGLECEPDVSHTLSEGQLVGGWTIANSATGAAFGNDAIGLGTDGTMALIPTTIDPTNIRLQTFNPKDLGDSEVILLGIEELQGVGNFGNEIGPMIKGNPTVQCNATVYDNLENARSLPNVEFNCSGFAPIADKFIASGDTTTKSILGPGIPLNSSGFVLLSNCTSSDEESLGCTQAGGRCTFGPNGENANQFLFAFHGQAVGTFGAGIAGKYTNAAVGAVN